MVKRRPSIKESASEPAARAVALALDKKSKTVAFAESCTGGLLGHTLTNVAGSSKYFRGSVVAYHNDIKNSLLGVPKRTLKSKGAVSRDTAKAMAKGVRRKLKSTYGVSITGIAGPEGAAKAKPVGLVFIAVADTKKVTVKKLLLKGDRSKIKLRSAKEALLLLRKFIG